MAEKRAWWIVAYVLLVSTMLTAARDQRAVEAAPLPAQVVTAKKVFLAKGVGGDRAIRSGDDLAFDAFYAEMKRWGRFELVDAPEKADVLMELSYASAPARGRARDPRLTLKFIDPRTGLLLWSDSQARTKAFCRSNRERNLVKAVDQMITNLKTHLESQS
jgi:hypothetical protein